jgi:hypothetical protein
MVAVRSVVPEGTEWTVRIWPIQGGRNVWVLFHGDRPTVHQSEHEYRSRAEAATGAMSYLESTFAVDAPQRGARFVLAAP